MRPNELKMVIVLLCGTMAKAHADVIVAQPGTEAVTTNPPVAAVVAPATVVVPAAVVVPTPEVAVTDLEREGDWYVVYGTADLDRYHNILRVKDDKHGWITFAYRDSIQIYRRGQRVSYLDLNPGDTVTVRFKNT